jgi:hypothetical protein
MLPYMFCIAWRGESVAGLGALGIIPYVWSPYGFMLVVSIAGAAAVSIFTGAGARDISRFVNSHVCYE